MARAETCDGIPRPFRRRLLAAATEAGPSALARVRAVPGTMRGQSPLSTVPNCIKMFLPASAGRNAALLRTSRPDRTVADIGEM